MALVLDAGALIGVERQVPAVLDRLRNAATSGRPVRTSSAVVAQVWRDGARQAPLTLLLRGVQQVALDRDHSHSIGELLAKNNSDDVVDAAVLDIAADGDDILTSDPLDIAALAQAAGLRVRIIPI